MRQSIFSIFFLLVLNAFSFGQAGNYNLGEPEQLLDGISFNYQYQSGNAIHIEFKDQLLTYQWIAGPNKGKSAKTLPYKSRQLDEDVYYVNWHEIPQQNFITLVFNLKNKTCASSVIVRYRNEQPITAFEGGIIEQLKQ